MEEKYLHLETGRLTYKSGEIELPIPANMHCNVLRGPSKFGEEPPCFRLIAILLDAGNLALLAHKYCSIVKILKFVQLSAVDERAEKQLVLASHFYFFLSLAVGSLNR